ncbi:MAG: hypothetical protein FOGNACKC_02547 [Anaerolineae bacterium]|nr:hypothetical protein [Anaerolineae bacterium]
MNRVKNVLGGELKDCSRQPLTGFYRDGCCNTGADDMGMHTVCAQMTAEFLRFSQEMGNDLITPMPMFNFPGLNPGDKWCICVSRWVEAFNAGMAPPIDLEASHISVLEFVSLEDLKNHALAPE